MSDVVYIYNSKPKARKQHRCIWCGEAITVGEVHEKQVLKHIGDLHCNRFHMECSGPCSSYCSGADGEFMPYEGIRGKKEIKE